MSKPYTSETEKNIPLLHHIRPVGAELFQQTDRHEEANSSISQFLRTRPKIRRRVAVGGLVRQSPHGIIYITGQVLRTLDHPNRTALAIIHVGLANYYIPPLIQGTENIREQPFP